MRFASLVPKPSSPNGKTSVRRKHRPNFTRTSGMGAAYESVHPTLSTSILPKLEVGDAHDSLERQADAVADRVMRMPAPRVEVSDRADSEAEDDLEADLEDEMVEAPLVGAFAGDPLTGGHGLTTRRKCASCEAEERDELRRSTSNRLLLRTCAGCEVEDELRRACASCDNEDDQLMRACASCEEDEALMREPAASQRGGVVSDSFAALLRPRMRTGGEQLPISAQRFLAPRFGVDLQHVRVHADATAGELATQINARAFTVGSSIFFAPGELRPHTQSGMHLIAHEVTHTLQNRGIGEALDTHQHRSVNQLWSDDDEGASSGSVLRRSLEYVPLDTSSACTYGLPEKSAEQQDEEDYDYGEGQTDEEYEEEMREWSKADEKPSAPSGLSPECAPQEGEGKYDNVKSYNWINVTIANVEKKIEESKAPTMAICDTPIALKSEYQESEFTKDITVYDEGSIPAPPKYSGNSESEEEDDDHFVRKDAGKKLSKIQKRHLDKIAGYRSSLLTPKREALASLRESAMDGAALSIVGGQDDIIQSYEAYHHRSQTEIAAWRDWGEEKRQRIIEWHTEKVQDVETERDGALFDIESAWEKKTSTVESKVSRGIDTALSAIETDGVDQIGEEADRLKGHVSKAGHEVANRYLLGIDFYDAPGGAVLRWMARKSSQVDDYSTPFEDKVREGLSQSLCQTATEVDTGLMETNDAVIGVADQIGLAAEPVIDALTAHAADMCAAVAATVNTAVSTLEQNDQIVADNARETLASYVSDVIGNRNVAVENIDEGLHGLGLLQAALDKAEVIVEEFAEDKLSHAEFLRGLYDEIVKDLDSFDMERLSANTAQLWVAGTTLAGALLTTVQESEAEFNKEKGLRESNTDMLEQGLTQPESLIGCYKQAADSSAQQVSSGLESLVTYAVDAFAAFIANIDMTAAREQFRELVEDEEGYGTINSDGFYSGLLEKAEEAADRVEDPLPYLVKDAALFLAGVAVVGLTILAIEFVPFIGIPLAIIVLGGLAIRAIETYREARAAHKTPLEAVGLTLREITNLNEIEEEFSRAEPNFFRIGMLTAEGILVVVIVPVIIYGGYRVARLFTQKYRALYATRKALLELTASFSERIEGVRKAEINDYGEVVRSKALKIIEELVAQGKESGEMSGGVDPLIAALEHATGARTLGEAELSAVANAVQALVEEGVISQRLGELLTKPGDWLLPDRGQFNTKYKYREQYRSKGERIPESEYMLEKGIPPEAFKMVGESKGTQHQKADLFERLSLELHQRQPMGWVAEYIGTTADGALIYLGTLNNKILLITRDGRVFTGSTEAMYAKPDPVLVRELHVDWAKTYEDPKTGEIKKVWKQWGG